MLLPLASILVWLPDGAEDNKSMAKLNTGLLIGPKKADLTEAEVNV